jgi:hypothetical protein
MSIKTWSSKVQRWSLLPWASRGPADGASRQQLPEMTSGPPSNPMTNHKKDKGQKINKSWANQVIRGQLVTFCRPYLDF